MNTITLTGNLTKDPEIRYLNDGTATCNISLAVNRRRQDKQTQEWIETTSFFDVVAWRAQAENVALSLSKGDRIIVTGRLEQRSWLSPEGEKRSKIEMIADEIGVSLLFGAVATQTTYNSEPALADSEPF